MTRRRVVTLDGVRGKRTSNNEQKTNKILNTACMRAAAGRGNIISVGCIKYTEFDLYGNAIDLSIENRIQRAA